MKIANHREFYLTSVVSFIHIVSHESFKTSDWGKACQNKLGLHKEGQNDGVTVYLKANPDTVA